MRGRLSVLFAFAVLIVLISRVFAQQPAAPPAGRGQGQGKQGGGAVGGAGFGRGGTPTFPGPPAGMQALPLDLFASKNFYQDRKLNVRPAVPEAPLMRKVNPVTPPQIPPTRVYTKPAPDHPWRGKFRVHLDKR